MKRTKKLLSFFLAIMMVITTIPAFTITSNAANFNGPLTNNGSYYIYNVIDGGAVRKGKHGAGSINISNDGGYNNFCSGWWGFSITSIPSSIDTITADISITVPEALSGNTGISVYATDNSITGDTTVSGSGATARDNALAKFPKKKLLGTYTSKSAGTFTATIGDKIKEAKQEGWTNFNIFAIQSGVGNGNNSNNNWSDVWFKVPVITVNAVEKALSTTASAEDNANSVTNRLIIDDAIYTYKSSSERHNYGTVISDIDPWDTKIVFRQGYSRSNLRSITCLDNGAPLTLNGNNQLTGNLLSDNFKVSGKTDVNATLLFTFTDGAKEYHRVAVKSYPIESHVAVQSWYQRTGGNRESGYTLYLRNSTGSSGKGLFNGYYTYLGTYGQDYTTNSSGGYGNAVSALNTSVDKKAGIGYTNQNDAFPPSVSVGTYYIDKSCHDTSWAPLGNSELWNGSQYSFNMDIVRTMFVDSLGDRGATSTPRNTTGATVSGSYTKNDTNGRTNRYTFTKSTGIKKATDYNYHYNIQNTDGGSAGMRANIEVKLFNKKTARDLYSNYIDEDKKEVNYTASSFATYQNALMAMEAYLSNYEDTSEATTSSTVYTTLVNAHNNLQPRATEAQFQELLRLDQQLKTAKSYATSEPIDRPYTNTSYNKFRGALVNDPTGEAEQYLPEYQAGTKDLRDFAQSTYTTYKNAYNSVLGNLVERADFGYYDEQADAVAGRLTDYTAKDGQYIRLYSVLEPYKSITLYTDAQKIETPKTSQTTVNNVGSAIANANTGVYNSNPVDQTALKAFIDKKFDLDVVDNSNITDQKKSANGLYEKITFNGNEYWSLNVADQAELDSNIAGYINSINSTLGKYDIKVPDGISVAVSGQPQTPTSTSTIDGIITHTYRLTYGVPVTFTSTNADTAWYMSYVSNVAQRGVQYQCSGETYATKVMGNMTITPKARVNDTTPNKVTVVRQYSDGSSSAMLIDYVNGSYVLPTAQTYPNYTFTGYEVAPGSRATIENGTVTGITGDTIIYAKYTPANGEHRIIVKDTNGTTITDSNYKYNSAVKLNDPNAYAWIERRINSNDTWRPSYIGTGCSYKVTEPMELMAVKTEAEMKQYCGTKEAYAPNLRYNGPLVVAHKGIVFHGQFINYVPANAEIVEYGVLVYKGNSNDFDLTSDKENIIRCKSTNPMKSNQFSVGALYSQNFPEGSEISYKSYMIYQIKENGTVIETKYAYSDHVRHYPENA